MGFPFSHPNAAGKAGRAARTALGILIGLGLTATGSIAEAANALPTISAVPAQSLARNATSAPIPFTVGDLETPAASLVLAGNTSNVALMPLSGIAFGGSGALRTVTLTPAPNQTGTCSVRIWVQDASGGKSSCLFSITVTGANTPPTITAIPAQGLVRDTPSASIPFTIGDAETPATGLALLGNTSNTALIPLSGIAFGGSGASRTVVLTPAPGQTGSGSVRIWVSDAAGAKTSTLFSVTVAAPNGPPSITPIPDQILGRNVASAPIPFDIEDAETQAASLTVLANSSNVTLMPLTGIRFEGTGSRRTLTLTPAADQTGTCKVRIWVKDASGATNSAVFQVQVLDNLGSFALNVHPTWFQLAPGTSKAFQVQRISLDGFNQAVDVAFSGVPAGVTLTPSSLRLSNSDVITVIATAAAGIPRTNATLTCTGTFQSLTDSKAVQFFWDVPAMAITTTAPIQDPTGLYVTGHISLDPGGAFACETDTEIRGRGNSTWSMPKKPYKVKLPKKAPVPLLGMPTHNQWALLANYSDKSLMRNAVAMELSRRLGMPYTPRSAYVDLTMNGSFDGTYLVMESIKIDPTRVNIPAMKAADTSGEALTGGYLLEIDERFEQAWLWPGNNRTAHGVAMGLQDPEVPTPEQQTYIVNYIQEAENAVFRTMTNDYEQYLDVDSFINWYLLNELFANVDSYGFGSCWMYKNRSGKLFMGPAWDFDLGAGNVDYAACQYPTGWWTRKGVWYTQLFQNPAFAQKVKARWNAVKAAHLDTIGQYIDQNAALLDRSQAKNFERWPILGVYVWPNPYPLPTTYAGEVDYLKTWITQRIAWMDSQFNP